MQISFIKYSLSVSISDQQGMAFKETCECLCFCTCRLDVCVGVVCVNVFKCTRLLACVGKGDCNLSKHRTAPITADLLRFPAKMEDYQIIRELGRGRFGVVFEVKVTEGKTGKVKVIDEGKGQSGTTHYAMKKIRVTGTMDDIHTELANHRALPPHPNIEAFYQFFQQGQEVSLGFLTSSCFGVFRTRLGG